LLPRPPYIPADISRPEIRYPWDEWNVSRTYQPADPELLRRLTLVTHRAQVGLTTQQQRSATSQVVETMEQLSDVSRQVSDTASQIADASANLATLAANLERTAAASSPTA